MEPVPETEKMEEFTSSPLPTLRLPQSSVDSFTGLQTDSPFKPPTIRRSTDPSSPSSRSPGWASPTLPLRPATRNTSPYSRGHARSRSSQSALAPPMTRAQSLPGVHSVGHLFNTPQRPASPRGSPHRRLPRKPVDEIFPGLSGPPPQRTQSLGNINEISSVIPEDEEVTPRGQERSESPVMGISSYQSNVLPRLHRPSSPLRSISLQQGGLMPSTPSSITSSPSYQTTKFNDSALSGLYSYTGYASSSIPSTPTSLRSRSPSISSLETIPDTPDAEEAAIEAHRIAQLKAAADEAEGDEAAMELKRKNSLEAMGVSRGRTLGLTFGSRDKRKRWSVCGAERRGDLDLETIWED